MSSLNKAAILNGGVRLQVRKVDTPEWGGEGHVYVRALSAGDAADVQRLAADQQAGKANEAEVMVGWCILGICDGGGKRLFDDADTVALLKGPLMPIQRCTTAIMELNHITEEATQARKKGSPRRRGVSRSG